MIPVEGLLVAYGCAGAAYAVPRLVENFHASDVSALTSLPDHAKPLAWVFLVAALFPAFALLVLAWPLLDLGERLGVDDEPDEE